jgi:hypothetical protein
MVDFRNRATGRDIALIVRTGPRRPFGSGCGSGIRRLARWSSAGPARAPPLLGLSRPLRRVASGWIVASEPGVLTTRVGVGTGCPFGPRGPRRRRVAGRRTRAVSGLRPRPPGAPAGSLLPPRDPRRRPGPARLRRIPALRGLVRAWTGRGRRITSRRPARPTRRGWPTIPRGRRPSARAGPATVVGIVRADRSGAVGRIPSPPLRRIGQQLVGGLDGEEAHSVPARVGMVGLGKAPMRGLDLGERGAAADAEHAVRIGDVWHGKALVQRSSDSGARSNTGTISPATPPRGSTSLGR